MLVLQTAFAQETMAILRAGKRASDLAGQPVIEIAGQPCLSIETGIGLVSAQRAMRELLSRIESPALVISIGLAGALDPSWQIGDSALIDSVCLDESSSTPHAKCSSTRRVEECGSTRRVEKCSVDALRRPIYDAARRETPFDAARRTTPFDAMPSVPLVSLKKPAFSSAAKLALSQRVAAQLCDMETYAVASECEAREIPWLGVRVVSDTFHEELQEWTTFLPALMSQRRWFRVAGLVATHPQDLPSLVRLGFRMHALQRRLTQLIKDLVAHVQSA